MINNYRFLMNSALFIENEMNCSVVVKRLSVHGSAVQLTG